MPLRLDAPVGSIYGWRSAGSRVPRAFGLSPAGARLERLLDLIAWCGLALGLLFPLHAMIDIHMSWREDWRPVAPIGFGIYLLVRWIQDRRGKAEAGDPRSRHPSCTRRPARDIRVGPRRRVGPAGRREHVPCVAPLSVTATMLA